MPKGGNYEYTAKLLVSAGMDEKSVQQTIQEEKRLVKLVKEEFEDAFKNFGKVINDALAKVKLKQIPLDDILDVSDIMGTMGKLGDHIRDEVVNGLKGATAGGVDVGDVIGDNLDFSDRLQELKAQRKQLTEELELIQKTQMKNKTKMDKLSKFEIENVSPLKVDGDLIKQAEKQYDDFVNLRAKLKEAEGTPDYASVVLDAQEQFNNMYKMAEALKQSKLDISDDVKAMYDLLKPSKRESYELKGGEFDPFNETFSAELIGEEFDKLEEVFVDANWKAKEIKQTLESINNEIDNIIQNAKKAGDSALKDVVNAEKDLEAARKRMINDKSGTYNQPKLKKIDSLLGDEPPKIEDSLKSLKQGYDKAVANDLGWEEQYQWLVKFVQKYNQLQESGKNKSTLAEFKDVYDSFMQQYPEAISSLKELRALIDDNPLTRKKQTKGSDDDSTYKPGDLLNNPAFANMFKQADDGADEVNKSLTEQEDLLLNIRKLTSYIDEEYLSAGKHLSDFLNDLQGESNELDSELKEVLSTLRLIDAEGKPTFDVKRNGEDGGGTTHNGALISDDFVLIERDDYQKVKDSELPSATQKAYDDGVNVAKVLDYIPSKYNGGFFDVQNKAHGKNLFDNGVISEDVVNATEEQLRQLVNAFIVAREHGFDIENGGSNIVYDKDEGFSFYDLEEWSQEDKDYWNNLSDGEKKLRALEDALSIFAKIEGENLNRDYTDIDNDPNRENFIDKFKKAVSSDDLFSDVDYDHVFNSVFSEYASIFDKFEDMFKGKKGKQDTDIDDFLNNLFGADDKEETDARRQELIADLDKYGADVLTSKDADDNLKKLEETYNTLKKEGLLTEELEESYNRLNQKLEERANLLRQAEGYYDDVDGVLGDQRVDSIDSAEQYRKEHIKPFDDVITNMSDSGLFSDTELEKFEKISKSMEDRAKQLPFDEIFGMNDIYNTKDLAELESRLERIKSIMATSGEEMQIFDPQQYDDALTLMDDIEDRMNAIREDQDDRLYEQMDELTYKSDYFESSEELEEKLKKRQELMSQFNFTDSDDYKELEQVNEEIEQRIALMKELEPLVQSGKLTQDDLEGMVLERGSLDDRREVLEGIKLDIINQDEDDVNEALNSAQSLLDIYEKISVTTASGKKLELGPEMSPEDFKAFMRSDPESAKSIEFIRKAAVEADAAVDDLNDSLEQTNKLSNDGKAGTGTGDASSAEIERLQQENKELLGKIEDAENDSNYYYGKMRDAEEEANAADKRAQEAEEELARMKADADGKKLVDNDGMDGDEVFTLRNQLADTENALADEMSARWAAEKEAANAKEEAEQLRKQLADKKMVGDDGQGADPSKEMADVAELQSAIEKVTAAVKDKSGAFEAEEAQVRTSVSNEIAELDQLTAKLKEVQDLLQNIQTGKIGTGGNIKIDVGAQLSGSDIATEGTLSSILGAVNSIDGKVTKGSQANKGNTAQNNNTTQKKNSNTFDLDKDIAKRDLLKLRAELSTNGDLKGKRNLKMNTLWSDLDKVTDAAGLSQWKKEFQKYQKGLKIGGIFDKAHQDADKAAYEQLIALKKTEYDLEKRMLKAGPNEKSGYEKQLETIREMIAQQKIVHKNMEYENKLAQMQAKHNDDITNSKNRQVDAENAKKQKQEEAEVVRGLINLYEQLGRAQAQSDAAETSRLRGEISTERSKLSKIDYDTNMKFKHAKEKGSDAVIKERENAVLKEQKQIVSELIALYKQLGQADAKADFATNAADQARYEKESQDIQEQIRLKEQMLQVDKKMRDQFDDAWTSGVDKETGAELEKLGTKYKELGELRAKIADAPQGEYRSGLEKDLITLEDSIEADKQKLRLNKEMVASYEEVANAAEKVAQVELRRKKDQAIDKSAAAYEETIAKEELKRRQQELAAAIKLQRKMAGIGDADSALNTGRKSLLSTYKLDGLSEDAISQLPAVEKLTQALKELQDVRSRVPADGNIGEDLAAELQQATREVLKHSDAVRDLINDYEKFDVANAIDFNRKLDPNVDTKQQLIDAARSMYGNKVSFKSFNEETQEAVFNLKGANREVTEIAIGVRKADGEIKGLKGSTKQTEGFFEAMGRKAKEIASYISVMDVYYKAMEWTRQGIQYVREIDSAMVELKKVTDETSATYDNFMASAAQSAEKVGTTMTNIINSTADWARIGYSMADATKLAESTSVLLNVSEFGSVDEATSALTSTMQAFDYTADESMHVVDIMNEIGNNYAVSSDGIATALSDSASALMMANNSYEEAVAMVAAANKVVNFVPRYHSNMVA